MSGIQWQYIATVDFFRFLSKSQGRLGDIHTNLRSHHLGKVGILRRFVVGQLSYFDQNRSFSQTISVVFPKKQDSGQNFKFARLQFDAEYSLSLSKVISDLCESCSNGSDFYVQVVQFYDQSHVHIYIIVFGS